MDEQPRIMELDTRLRALESWSAKLDGANSANWRHQSERNGEFSEKLNAMSANMENRFSALSRKITALEVKVAVFSAAAAALGSIAANYLPIFGSH